MGNKSVIKSTPWDAKVFGLPTWELLEYSESALRLAVQKKGHHTIKVDPLANKKLLFEFGFYYCDTLIEPHCSAARLREVSHVGATISKNVVAEQVLEICRDSFVHGRFHRDFNLSRRGAEQRYENWLSDLILAEHVYGLFWHGELSGFIGYNDNNLVLHALAEKIRGKGLSKYWWSAVCSDLFAAGNDNIGSSISAANIAVLNLYASLGFCFKKPHDIYHRIVL